MRETTLVRVQLAIMWKNSEPMWVAECERCEWMHPLIFEDITECRWWVALHLEFDHARTPGSPEGPGIGPSAG